MRYIQCVAMDGIILLTRVKGSSLKATFEIEDDPIEEISLSQFRGNNTITYQFEKMKTSSVWQNGKVAYRNAGTGFCGCEFMLSLS